MPRNFFPVILVGLFLTVVTAVSQAQIEPAAQAEEKYIVIPNPQPKMRDVGASMLEEGEGMIVWMSPLSFDVDDPPSDLCEDATPMVVSFNENNGGVANVKDATEESTDPILSCMWGQPASSRGFRTVWYELIAPVSGTVTISTFGSSYDTVLAVHRGTCDALTTLRCSDDYNGFSSQATVSISQDETYYIEIADRQFGLSERNAPDMSIAALLVPVNSKWDAVLSSPAVEAVTRHAVVAQGQYLYVIGGERGPEGELLPSNRAQSFDTVNKTWAGLPEIPGSGYANTTAALVDGIIYLPTGDSGNSSGYDGKHLRFNIAGNTWVSNAKETPRVGGKPFAWSYAVVPPSNDRYFLAGGMTSTELASPTADVIDQTFEYVPSKNSWKQLGSMQAGRYAHTAAWLEGGSLGICVAGGLGTGENDLDEPVAILHRSMECSQPDGSWQYKSDMNIARFGAGSAVGSDGKWYVFGGVTVRDVFNEDGELISEFATVAQTEVYDPVTNVWNIMQAEYDLAAFDSMPARFWPRGAMVNDTLWVVGGSIAPTEVEQALPTIDRLLLPSVTVPLPIIFSIDTDDQRPDDTFSQARHLPLGTQQSRNFDQQLDFFDFYFFDIHTQQRGEINLQVPNNNNFDLMLYGENKTFLDSSTNLFTDEHISISLSPGRYYIVVTRVPPPNQPDKNAYYTVSVQ